MGTTAKGAPFPEGTDPPLGPAQIAALAAWADNHAGVTVATYAAINAYAGADVWEGRTVYQSDTGTNRPYEGIYTHNGIDFRKPWDLPWGILENGRATTTGNQTGNGAANDVTGLTLTNTLIANRWIRATLNLAYSQNSSGTCVFSIHDGTNHTVFSIENASSAGGRGEGSWEFVSTAGSKTVKAQVASAAGTVDLIASSTNPGRLVLVDLGPAGAAA